MQQTVAPHSGAWIIAVNYATDPFARHTGAWIQYVLFSVTNIIGCPECVLPIMKLTIKVAHQTCSVYAKYSSQHCKIKQKSKR